ncbi:MAG: family 16 glycosylhydrolase [Caldilineaceae bacterium]|nr:family 16 glycosylhydrolase [Caldilineaceae bacterium]
MADADDNCFLFNGSPNDIEAGWNRSYERFHLFHSWSKLRNALWAADEHTTLQKPYRSQLLVSIVLCLLATLAAACTDLIPVPVSEVLDVAVRIPTANLREGPGLSHPIASRVSQGTLLKVQGRNSGGDWVQVAHEGQTLWIHADHTDLATERLAGLPVKAVPTPLSDSAPATPTPVSVALIVTGTVVNVRTGPSIDFPVRSQVRQGDQLQPQGLNAAGDWVQVSDPTGGTELLWIYAPLTDLEAYHRAVLPAVAAPALPDTPTPEPTPTVPVAQDVPCPLVWSDEFEEDGLPDSAKWWFDQRPNRWYSDALTYWTKRREANARIEDGRLIIEAHKEDYGGREFTVARLTSKQAWTYGWYEISARLPEGRGVKSAIWMVSNSNPYGSWPGSGEIDIMEFVGYKPGIIHATVHTEAYNHRIGNHQVKRLQIPDASSEFHLYGMEWTESAIKIHVDDTHYYTFENERLRNSSADQRHWPFDHPFHFILTISVGGGWAGTKGVDPDIWPQRMELDYMRIYACKP